MASISHIDRWMSGGVQIDECDLPTGGTYDKVVFGSPHAYSSPPRIVACLPCNAACWHGMADRSSSSACNLHAHGLRRKQCARCLTDRHIHRGTGCPGYRPSVFASGRIRSCRAVRSRRLSCGPTCAYRDVGTGRRIGTDCRSTWPSINPRCSTGCRSVSGPDTASDGNNTHCPD